MYGTRVSLRFKKETSTSFRLVCAMNTTLIGAALILLIAGIGIGYSFSYAYMKSEIWNLKSEFSMLRTNYDNLNTTYYELLEQYDKLQNDYDSLNSTYYNLQEAYKQLEEDYKQLEETYDQFSRYFFIRESDFPTSFDESDYWRPEKWNENPDSISEIGNGTLHLFYNETNRDWYGNSGAFQGEHPDEENTTQLLVGRTLETANFSEYVIFPKSMLSNKFQLNVSFRILNMGFNYYPNETFFDPTHARVNVGITLMCAFNDDPYTAEAETLWLDIYFAGHCLTETDIWHIPKGSNYCDRHEDFHAGYFVGEVLSSEFGKWITMTIDLGGYISKTLNLITEVDVKTIRVYGFVVFVECLGAYAEVEYDYIETYRA